MSHQSQDPQQPVPPNGWSGQPPQGGGYAYPPAPPNPPANKKNWFARHKVLTGLLAVAGIGIIIGATSSGGSSGDSATGATGASQASTATAAAAKTGGKASGTGTKASKSKASTSKDDKKKDSKPGIGTAVKSGDLQFTVTKVVRDRSSVGSEYTKETAQGKYTLVYVTVRNVGDDSETILDDDQKIKDADNKTYSPDTMAGIALNSDNNLFLEQINPGNAVDGVLVYDMPAGVRAAAIDFSGGLFDDSKTVQLK